METSDWVLLAIGVLIVSGVVIALALSSKARAASMLAAADMVESWHKRDVERKKTKLDALAADAAAHEGEINKLTKQLEDKRAKLRAKYEDKGITADEVMDRLTRLGL